MKGNIKIEEAGDINSDYPYLEVFYGEDIAPFLEISIDDTALSFKIYSTEKDILLNSEEWEYIHKIANDFLPRVLKNENDYLKWQGKDSHYSDS